MSTDILQIQDRNEYFYSNVLRVLKKKKKKAATERYWEIKISKIAITIEGESCERGDKKREEKLECDTEIGKRWERDKGEGR